MNPYSKFFNPDLGGSIPCRGRSTVSVSALTCEAAFSKYFPKNVDALINYIKSVEEEEIHPEALSVIEHMVVTPEMVAEHMGVTKEHDYRDTIIRILSGCEPIKLNLMYVKNNIKEFLYLPRVKTILQSIDSALSEKQIAFADPYHPPVEEELFKELTMLNENLLLGYYWYQGDEDKELKFKTNNTQDTIKSIHRKVISLIDTDSNMVYLEDVMQYVYDIMGKSASALTTGDYWITVANICMYLADAFIDKTLKRYIKNVNMLPEYFPRIRFKNEFLFKRQILTKSRKNYCTDVRLKEGKAYPEPVYDVKGLMYMKSCTNPTVGSMVENVIKDKIVMSDEINIKDILKTLRGHSSDLLGKLKTQEGLNFFQSVKLESLSKLKNENDYRLASMDIWNTLGLTQDKIVPPTRFYNINVTLDPERMQETYPEEYEKIKGYIARVNLNMLEQTLKSYDNFLKQIDIPTSLNKMGISMIDFLQLNLKDVKGGISEVEKDIIKYMMGILSERAVEEKDGRIKGALVRIYEKLSNDKKSQNSLKNFFKYEKAILQFEEIYDAYQEVIPLKKYKDFKDFKYIGLPQDASYIPQFIIDFLNTEKILGNLDNLSSVVIRELHVNCLRGKEGKLITTNSLGVF